MQQLHQDLLQQHPLRPERRGAWIDSALQCDTGLGEFLTHELDHTLQQVRRTDRFAFAMPLLQKTADLANDLRGTLSLHENIVKHFVDRIHVFRVIGVAAARSPIATTAHTIDIAGDGNNGPLIASRQHAPRDFGIIDDGRERLCEFVRQRGRQFTGDR